MPDEGLAKDRLIDQILVATMVAILLAAVSAQLRALDIGWGYRDLLQTILVGGIVALTLLRRRFAARSKALLLIALLTLGGVPGVWTLGMLAGTIYLYPTAVVIVAVFFSLRAALLYAAGALAFCVLVALRFCAAPQLMRTTLEMLVGNFYHWVVYLTCMGVFFGVAAIAIQRYRGAVTALLRRTRDQHDRLEQNNRALSQALGDVRKLSGLLPICSHCKKVRDDKGYWNRLEAYIETHSDAEFSHSICQECAEKYYPELDLYDEET